jgi:hypothetical protein
VAFGSRMSEDPRVSNILFPRGGWIDPAARRFGKVRIGTSVVRTEDLDKT